MKQQKLFLEISNITCDNLPCPDIYEKYPCCCNSSMFQLKSTFIILYLNLWMYVRFGKIFEF